MKIKKIKLLLLILLVFLSNGIFTEVKKAEACKCVICHYIDPLTCVFNQDAPGSDCDDTTHGCGSGNNTWPFSDSVCLIGGPQNRAECDDLGGGAGCPANNSWNYCSENQCLAGGPATDGDVCRVSTDATGCSFIDGVWDNSQGKCVQCPANNREMDNCGDITGTHFDGAFCTGFNNAMFESACGADSACDEQDTGDGCTIGQACENGGNPNCSGIDACDINGHCCIAPNVVDAVTGICVGVAACNCGADGCCNGAGCVATGGDPDCTCAELGGTDCGIAGSCDGATGSTVIANHSTATAGEVCCTGACVGCSPTCSAFAGHCLLSLANATVAIGAICCNGGQCYVCNSGFVWDSVLGICMPLGGGIPDMGHSTDHGNYFKYDKDVDLVFTEGAEFLLRIAGGLALFILVVGGVYYMVSGANPDGQTRAKKVVTYAVIGLMIVLIAYVIVMVVEGIAV